MNVVALIPARGGSKGIPRKNVVPFLGRPLITYTIEQSLAAEHVDGTVVSTDDDEIATVSESVGADVIERPAELARDESPTEDAMLHSVEVLEARGREPDVVVLLQCTSPLRGENDIDGAVELVVDGRYDSALSVCEDHSFYWRNEGGEGVPVNYDPRDRKRRQDMETQYRENGSIYVTEIDLLRQTACRLGGDVGLYVMPKPFGHEIDTPEDLRVVESIGREVDFLGKPSTV